MESIESIDFFADQSLVEDPYPYFEALRAECPVLPLPHLGVVAVTGYDEATRGLPRRRHVLVVQLGDRALRHVPGAARGRRRRATIIDQYRDQLPMHEHMVTMDPPDHTRRARAAHAADHAEAAARRTRTFMWRLADQQLDEFVADGRCEFISALLPALRHARRRRPARRARSRPPALPRGLRPARHRRRGRCRRGGRRERATRSAGSTSGSRSTSRTAGASRATTCSPTSRSRPTPTAPRPRSPPSCAPRRSCSPPARRRPPACSPPR